MRHTPRIVALLVVTAAFGCTLKVDPALVKVLSSAKPSPGATSSASPSSAPPSATPSAGSNTAANTGAVTGFVYGNAGKSQPIPLALVTIGAIKTYAGNPDKSKAISEDQEFADPANVDKDHFDVMHDFNDGQGPVETERIIRKIVPPLDPAAGDAINSRRNYVYLRAGEFFLEGVPAGDNEPISASFGTHTKADSTTTVYAGKLVTGVVFNLSIKDCVAMEDGRVPKLVSWVGTDPQTGITVSTKVTTTTQPDGTTQHDVTVTYNPDPPNATISLAAPCGSGGAVIKAADILYTFNTPNRQAAGKPAQQIGPIRLPIPPVTVSPSSDQEDGPTAKIVIPLGGADLRQALAGTGDPGDTPGTIVANIEFIDDAGFAVQDATFQNLQVSVPIRAL